GSVIDVELAWTIAGISMVFIAMINLVVITILAPKAILLLRHYSQQHADGLDPIFLASDLPELEHVAVWDESDVSDYLDKRSAGGRRCPSRAGPFRAGGRAARSDGGTAAWSGGDQIAVGLLVPVQADVAVGLGRLAELQEAAVAQGLLAELGAMLAHPVLQARQGHRAAGLAHDLHQQGEGVLAFTTLGKGHLRIARCRPFRELDDVALGQMAQHLTEGAESVIGFAEGGVLAQQGPLEHGGG